MLRPLLVSALLLASACATTVAGIHVQSQQMKVLPPLPPNCPIQLMTVGAAEMMPGADFGPGGKYDLVGSITVEAPEGTDPMNPELRDQVRPEACKLGGAVISLMVNGAEAFRLRRSLVTTTQQTLAFTVWGAHTAASSKPVAF